MCYMEIVLVASDILSEALVRLIAQTIPSARVRCAGFRTGVLSRDLIRAEYWIIEAFDGTSNAAGFRTARKLAGKARCLLIFACTPPGFPAEGPFWCHLLCPRLAERVRMVRKLPICSEADFRGVIEMWPLLGYEAPIGRHHHR